ncbi:MAG: hypothetical protein JRJ46_00985 [Deltaproteobacteria bacterium]|nr:hypothetical protein [Deltaproteobacteria bacterium]
MMIKVIRTFIAVGIITLLISTPAGAAEVRLKNGDRLTGEIVKMDADVIVLKTVYESFSTSTKDISDWKTRMTFSCAPSKGFAASGG